jgi:hypothetical protein
VPIALDGNGCHLVVELRAGDGYGVIGGLDPQANPRFEGINTWPSTAALLEHTANALHGEGTECTVTVQDGGLRWTL